MLSIYILILNYDFVSFLVFWIDVFIVILVVLLILNYDFIY